MGMLQNVSTMNRPSAADVLSRIPFFAQLRTSDLEAMAEMVVFGRYRKNQVLFVEGEPARSLYFILTGRVKVYRVSPDGREQILHLLGDGEPIAVVPFFDGGPYPATAEVLEDAEIAFIPFEGFERTARANPDVLIRMLRMMAQRMRHTQEELTALSLKNVTSRMAGRLLELSERYGEEVEDGIEVNLQLSRQEIGSLVSASRETTTRVLHQFQREGVIRIDGPRITIVKPFVLQAWSEQ